MRNEEEHKALIIKTIIFEVNKNSSFKMTFKSNHDNEKRKRTRFIKWRKFTFM